MGVTSGLRQEIREAINANPQTKHYFQHGTKEWTLEIHGTNGIRWAMPLKTEAFGVMVAPYEPGQKLLYSPSEIVDRTIEITCEHCGIRLPLNSVISRELFSRIEDSLSHQ